MQLSGSGSEGSGRGTTLEVTDSIFEQNSWAGISVGGGHRASIVGSEFTGNGQCGVCFFGMSTGSVEGSQFADNTVGLGATEAARPTWVGDTVIGGTVGVQLDGTAAPMVQGLQVTGAAKAAVVYSGQTGGGLTGLTCSGTPYGVVVADTATPSIGEISCPVARLGKA